MVEKLIALFFLEVSVIYIQSAHNLSFGSFAAPKAVFLPAIAGSMALILALILSISSFIAQDSRAIRLAKNKINWQRLIFVIIGLLVYIILLKLIGYMAATFISLLYLLKVADTAGWVYPCCFSAGIAVSFYFLFAELLGSNLP